MGFNNGIFTIDEWSPAEEALQPSEPDNYVASASAQAGLDEIAAGLSQTFIRDGSAAATGDFDLGGFRINNLTAGAVDSDAVIKSQLDAVSVAKADLDLQNVTSGAYASDSVRGVNFLANDLDMVSLTNNTKAVTPLQAGKLLSGSNAYSPGYINELIPVWSDADNISCSGGACRDSQNTINIDDSTTVIKDVSATWVVGTGGGLATGASTVGTINMFIIAGGIAPATTGTFTTDDISGNISNFQAITDGYLTYRVDNGALEKAENMDFSSILTVNDIANVFNATITNAQVIVVGNTIQFSSITTGPSSTFSIFASTETGTDMYPVSYLDGDNGLSVQGEAEQTEQTDYGFDSDVNATNLMADTNVLAAGLSKYRLICAFRMNGSEQFDDFDVVGDGNEIEIRYITTNERTPVSLTEGFNTPVFMTKFPINVPMKPILTYRFEGGGAGEGTITEMDSSDRKQRLVTYYKTTDSVGAMGYSRVDLTGATFKLRFDAISGTTTMDVVFYEQGYELTR